MKVHVVLIVFVVLFKGIEPFSVKRSYSKPSQRYYSSDSDSDSDYDDDYSEVSSDEDSDVSSEESEDDEGDSDSDDYEECPKVIMNNCRNVKYYCKNGKFIVNEIEIEKVKPSDKVVINENKLFVNRRYIRDIPPYNTRNTSSYVSTRSTTSKCPTSVVKINADNVSAICINGRFYVNGEELKDIKSTDKVKIITNTLKINNKTVRQIKPAKSKNLDNILFSKSFSNNNIINNSTNKYPKKSYFRGGYYAEPEYDEDEFPIKNMSFCNGISTRKINGKWFVNDYQLDYKPGDEFKIIANKLYKNNKYIKYIAPK